jgi:hypothetical protein
MIAIRNDSVIYPINDKRRIQMDVLVEIEAIAVV